MRIVFIFALIASFTIVNGQKEEFAFDDMGNVTSWTLHNGSLGSPWSSTFATKCQTDECIVIEYKAINPIAYITKSFDATNYTEICLKYSLGFSYMEGNEQSYVKYSCDGGNVWTTYDFIDNQATGTKYDRNGVYSLQAECDNNDDILIRFEYHGDDDPDRLYIDNLYLYHSCDLSYQFTSNPTTATPTLATSDPTTSMPTIPTLNPTYSPTIATNHPTTAQPTTKPPTTGRPTVAPTTSQPTTAAPTTGRPTVAPEFGRFDATLSPEKRQAIDEMIYFSDDSFDFLFIFGLFVAGYVILVVSAALIRCCKNGGDFSLGTVGFVLTGFQLGLDIMDVTTDIASSMSLIQGGEECGITACAMPDYSVYGYALIPFIIMGGLITLFTNIWGCAAICCLPSEYQMTEHEGGLGGTLTVTSCCDPAMCMNEAFWGYIKLVLEDAPALFIYIALYAKSGEDGVGASSVTQLALIFTTVDLCYLLVYSFFKGVYHPIVCLGIALLLFGANLGCSNLIGNDFYMMSVGDDCFDYNSEFVCSSDDGIYSLLLFETANYSESVEYEKIKYFAYFDITEESTFENIGREYGALEDYCTFLQNVDGEWEGQGNLKYTQYSLDCHLINSSDLHHGDAVDKQKCYTLRYDCSYDYYHGAGNVTDIVKEICFDVCEWSD